MLDVEVLFLLLTARIGFCTFRFAMPSFCYLLSSLLSRFKGRLLKCSFVFRLLLNCFRPLSSNLRVMLLLYESLKLLLQLPDLHMQLIFLLSGTYRHLSCRFLQRRRCRFLAYFFDSYEIPFDLLLVLLSLRLSFLPFSFRLLLCLYCLL